MTPGADAPVGLTPAQIEDAIAFHGHRCPGLAIGLRAAELALREVGSATDEDVVCVSETDMCGVDGIQFLTGCTLGKGNLILRDWGKIAFTFHRRRDGKGIRIHLRPEALEDPDAAVQALREKKHREPLTEEEEAAVAAARGPMTDRILAAPLEQLFELTPATVPVPGRAPRLESVPCAACGEPTMETRTRRHRGRWLCIPCFEQETRR